MRKQDVTHTTGHAGNLSRRSFIAGALAGSAGLAAAGLSGCSPATPSETSQNTSAQASFMVAPDPIPDSDIAETIEAEILVVGAGDSGLMAALAASELGADVMLIDKHEKFMAHGLAHGCIGTKIHRENGINLDKDRIVSYLAAQSNNRADQRLLRLWANESGAIYDHLIDMAVDAGLLVIPLGGANPDDPLYPEFDCALMFMGDTPLDTSESEGAVAQTWLFSVIEEAIRANGAAIRYNTTAEQLVQDENGRVTGIVAADENGSYLKLIASKAVVLATGDYGNDPELVEEWCPWQTLADVNFYTPPINTGDGHKMGLWVGAAMQAGPHCPALHPERVVGQAEPPMGASPVLRVNVNGMRYENEEVPAPLVCEGRIRQPQNKAWAVFDATWQEDAPTMSPGLLRTPSITEMNVESLEANALKADTIDGLAETMGVPADALVATVERYNELAQSGMDEDFGKGANNLWTIAEPPFYAIEVPVGTMNTLGGLLVNDSMQVLSDADDGATPIPGLYAAGNVSGGFFGSTYPSAVSGINKGWSIVGGYLAGQHAVND